MKHLLSILAAALLLTGCTQVSERGEQLGRQLVLAWGDTAAVKAIDDQYQAAADSLHIPGTAGHLASAFMQAVGDNDSVSYIEFAKNYLQSLIAFVNDEPVDELFTSPGDAFTSATSTKLRVNIVELLKEYGKDENSTLLNNAIESENPTISKIAKLIQSNNMMKKVLEPGVLSVIKHEILKSLSIENEKDTDFEADSKPYIGMESSTIEFKMSAIFDSNKTDIPDETKQNSVIANTVCAFLNSQAGGTLYIGVNNQGYVEGIDNDMKYKRYNDIDTYSRYIQDMLKQRLGKDASSYWIIELAYNNKVLVVNVQPHPYQVVEHNNKAYARRNSESIIMTEDMRLELISEKQKRNKEKAYNISWLRRANQLHKCVILHGYASSNGKRINDRRIEPCLFLRHLRDVVFQLLFCLVTGVFSRLEVVSRLYQLLCQLILAFLADVQQWFEYILRHDQTIAISLLIVSSKGTFSNSP